MKKIYENENMKNLIDKDIPKQLELEHFRVIYWHLTLNSLKNIHLIKNSWGFQKKHEA